MWLSYVLHIPSAILLLSLESYLREIKKKHLHRNTEDRSFNTVGKAFTELRGKDWTLLWPQLVTLTLVHLCFGSSNWIPKYLLSTAPWVSIQAHYCECPKLCCPPAFPFQGGQGRAAHIATRTLWKVLGVCLSFARRKNKKQKTQAGWEEKSGDVKEKKEVKRELN